jgi:hypothetical protein
MLKTTNERFESEVFKHLGKIESIESKKIYKFILAESVFLKEFDCEPGYRGETSHLDFRFLLKSDNSKNCFAIKIGEVLTFYFRPIAAKYFNKDELLKIFPHLQENKGEYFFVLEDVETWYRVLNCIQRFKI